MKSSTGFELDTRLISFLQKILAIKNIDEKHNNIDKKHFFLVFYNKTYYFSIILVITHTFL